MLGGVAFFLAAERGAAAVLSARDLHFPPAIAALLSLGCVCAVPSAGVRLQRLLGPSAAWLRAALPVLLVPAFLFPAVAAVPDGDSLRLVAPLCLAAIMVGTAAAGVPRCGIPSLRRP